MALVVPITNKKSPFTTTATPSSVVAKSPWRRKKMAAVPAIPALPEPEDQADLFDLSDWYSTAKQHPPVTSSTPTYRVSVAASVVSSVSLISSAVDSLQTYNDEYDGEEEEELHQRHLGYGSLERRRRRRGPPSGASRRAAQTDWEEDDEDSNFATSTTARTQFNQNVKKKNKKKTFNFINFNSIIK